MLEPNSVPWIKVKPGAGPRHLAFHPNGKWAYLINELDSTVTVLSYDGRSGTFKELQVVPTLPEDFRGESTCADVQVAPSGRFVYGSNRGHNSIVIYRVDPRTGRLSLHWARAHPGQAPRAASASTPPAGSCSRRTRTPTPS